MVPQMTGLAITRSERHARRRAFGGPRGLDLAVVVVATSFSQGASQTMPPRPRMTNIIRQP